MQARGNIASVDHPIVGREAELETIRMALVEARGGRGTVLVIRGEPGIGKTTLLQASIALAEGMRVVTARGIEAESELGFAVLSDVLRPLLEHLDSLLPHQRAVLEGALALGPPTYADALATSAAALALLAAASEDQSLLVVVDDFQWLDSPSQLALVFIARRIQAERISLLIAARDLSPQIEHAGLMELHVEKLVDAQASALLMSYAPNVSRDVAAAILDAAAGNPLALVEMTSFLDEDQLTGRVPLPSPLPVNGPVEAAFTELLERLGPAARRAIVVIAADDTGDISVVRRAADSLGIAAVALDEAEEAGVLVIDPRLRFRHPILRSLVYARASERERRLAHGALAAAIPEGDRYRRAWHRSQAVTDPDEGIAQALEDVAAEARTLQRFSSAAAACDRAANLTPDSAARARRLVLAARDLQLSGQLEAAGARLTEALGLTDDVPLRAEAQRLRAMALFVSGDLPEAIALLEREAELIADRDPDAAALLLAQASIHCQPAARIDQGLETGRRAVEVARNAGAGAQFAAGLAYAQSLSLRGDSTAVQELHARARAVLPLDDPFLTSQLLQSEAGHLMIIGEHETARGIMEQLVAGARTAGAPAVLPFPLALLAEIHFRSGRWSDALAGALEALELAEQTGQTAYAGFVLPILARIEAGRGLEEAALAHAERADEIGRVLGIDAQFFYAPAARAFLALTVGDLEEAVAHGQQAEEISRERGLCEPAVVLWAPDLIESFARLGRVDDATRVLERFTGEAIATRRVWALATGARCRGLLEDDFEGAFAEALSWHEGLEMPFERARTELCLGERRRRAGRRVDARIPLRSALRTFERLGSPRWAERALAELRATGERIRRRDPALTDQLTPHELRVALVVARGATNREAAAQLFISPKTVDFHLQRVYRKLGIGSRSELARTFAERQPIAQTSST